MIIAGRCGEVEGSIGVVFICRPLTSELVWREQPCTKWLMKTTIGCAPQTAGALPLCPSGGGGTVLAKAMESGCTAKKRGSTMVKSRIKVSAVC
jgi:hypothetical protein